MEIARDKARAGALNLVRAGRQLVAGQCLRDHRRVGRLHRDGLKRRLARLDHFTAAGERATGAHAGHDDVDCAVGVVPDFLGGGLAMNLQVGRVFKLLGDPRVWRLGCQLIGPLNGPLHALRPLGEDEFGAEHRQQCAALERHGLRHGKDQPVAFGRRDERQRNAGVAARRLDDDSVLGQRAALFGILDHRHANAILHAGERVEEFALEQHGGVDALGDLVEPHQRRASNGLHNVIKYISHFYTKQSPPSLSGLGRVG